MELELDPDQPVEVADAIASALRDDAPAPDPWWRAGVEEQLEP
jgi:hypothetical protein